VRGEPITEYCDVRGLALDDRLRLFHKVLGAVQYARQKAIVHRVLKPSNVLVAEGGGVAVPKVLDFGVPRIVGDAADADAGRTTCGTVIDTREYMSPEPAAAPAAGVDTRLDIYSLGLLLYELLTGRLPVPAPTLRRASPGELERLLRDTEPPLPSRRVAAADSRTAEHARARARPSARWHSRRDVGSALSGLGACLTAAARAVTRVRAAPAPAQPRRSRRPARPAASARGS
jgi:eukaryotic-like serine/threonine-protein kinase